jgi:dodecin
VVQPLLAKMNEENRNGSESKVVGTSKESFAKAAENAVKEAAKTVRGLKWVRVPDWKMELDGNDITQYRITTNIYFDIEQ